MRPVKGSYKKRRDIKAALAGRIAHNYIIPRALPWANEKLHLHTEARSKHDIRYNHIINMMVATTPVANAMGNGFLSPWATPWAFRWVFCASTDIPPNGLDSCLCQQRAESPMVSIAHGQRPGRKEVGAFFVSPTMVIIVRFNIVKCKSAKEILFRMFFLLKSLFYR